VVNTSNVLEELAASIFWEEEEDRGSRFLWNVGVSTELHGITLYLIYT
jgi:hypothetical protein